MNLLKQYSTKLYMGLTGFSEIYFLLLPSDYLSMYSIIGAWMRALYSLNCAICVGQSVCIYLFPLLYLIF